MFIIGLSNSLVLAVLLVMSIYKLYLSRPLLYFVFLSFYFLSIFLLVLFQILLENKKIR